MLSKEFSNKNSLQIAILRCQEYIQTIDCVTLERNNVLKWFQVLCEHLTKVITLIRKYCKKEKENENKSFQNTLLLYTTQILSALSLMINVFVKEDEIKLVLKEARKCPIKQTDYCLENIEMIINSETRTVNMADNFVKWMDCALEKVSEIEVQINKSEIVAISEEVQTAFEEVLSHAMSIAQVSLEEDGKIIRGSCQTVLDTVNALSKEIHKDTMNGAMIKLFVDASTDKLCLLERKVNTAVLKLCLNAFSNFTEPLEKIRRFCFAPANRTKVDDFDCLVADYDLHVDRLMQIGLFAVSCCNDFTRCIKIRSCMASLEALESELVPSLHLVLRDNSVDNMNSANVLMQHWLDQANKLQHLIYLIIDPSAFCQVVYEEVAQLIDDFSFSIKKKNVLIQNDVNRLIDVARVLQQFLDIAQSEFTESEANRVKMKAKDFKDIIEEVDVASKMLLSVEIVNLECSKRILKRCKILLTVLKRLWYCFVDDILNINKQNITLNYEISEKQTREFEKLKCQETDNVLLDRLMNRGKQILQDRSILYKMPVKMCHLLNEEDTSTVMLKKNERKQVTHSKLVHLRKFSFSNTDKRNDTSFDLELTEILNEITTISIDFNKEIAA